MPSEIGYVEVKLAIIVIITQRDAHGGHDFASPGEGHPGEQADFVESAVVLVMVEVCIEPIVGDEQVGPAIVIVVSSAHRKILAFGLVDPCRRRHVGESTISIVVVENVGTAFVDGGRTIRADVDEITVARAILVQGDIATDVKIEEAIAIVIEECGSAMKESAGLRAGDARLVGRVGESTISVVVVQNVATVLGDVEIGKAVVVVVSPNTAEAKACTGNASFFRDLSEAPVAVVAVKRIAHGDAPAVKIAAIDEVNVLEAVTVEICHAETGTKHFADYRDAVIATVMDELDASRRGHSSKLHRNRVLALGMQTHSAVVKTRHENQGASQRKKCSARPAAPKRTHRWVPSICGLPAGSSVAAH